ncbi:MAG: sodium:proton antiporter, partial [Raoultibacter sp.]
IHIKGTIAGTTRNNVILLAIGTLLSSWIGTTGAAMLLIRPILRANSWRRNKIHIVVFFIFLVANIGGCLTPIGDPPLFLGYLRGVPFFWTLQHIWPMLLLNTAVLLAVFTLIDRHFIKKEGREGTEALDLEEKATEHVPIRIEGAHNLIFLAMIIVAVILNGVIQQTDTFLDPATGLVFGVNINEHIHLGFNY